MPDGIELEELCKYAEENSETKNDILIHLMTEVKILYAAVNSLMLGVPFQIMIRTFHDDFFCENYKAAGSKDKKNEFVYLAIVDNEKNIYKIGRTNDISRRESQLVTGNFHLTIYAYTQCFDSTKLEAYLHRLFSSKCIKNEWFFLSDSDIQFLIDVFAFKIGIV